MKNQLKSFLENEVLKGSFPGAGYAVIKDNNIILEDYVGYKSVFPVKEKNTGNEIYDIASLTKVVCTTSLVMKLIEQKQLSLESKIYSFLPRFKHHQITVYQLLTHTSGLPADIRNASRLRHRLEVEEIIYSMDLLNPPGEKIVYSDIGFILLGWMIEAITKTSLDVYAQEVLFNPLGMKDTGFHPNPERCAPTEIREDQVFIGLLKGKVHDEKSFALGGVSGHAGLFSTPHDIGLFILAILNQNPICFSEETLDQLFSVREEDVFPSGKPNFRALGWEKPTKGGTAGDYADISNTIIHTGFTGCNIIIERKRRIGFVLLSNGVHPKREMNKIPLLRNKIGNMILTKKGDFEI